MIKNIRNGYLVPCSGNTDRRWNLRDSDSISEIEEEQACGYTVPGASMRAKVRRLGDSLHIDPIRSQSDHSNDKISATDNEKTVSFQLSIQTTVTIPSSIPEEGIQVTSQAMIHSNEGETDECGQF